jgi:hypothetical protein
MSKQFWLNAFLVAAIATGPAVAQSIVPIDPGTITNGHVYLMENVGANVPDDSANNNNATLLGGPQVVPGLNGNALKLNGTNQGAVVPNAAAVNTAIHQNKTVIAVFNCADVGKSAKQVVYEEGGSTRGLSIYVHQGSLHVGGWNRADYTPQWAPGTFFSAPIGSNEWHVVAVVLRGGTAAQAADKFEMWLDGALIGKGPGGEFRGRTDACGVGNVQAQTNFHDGTVNAGHWFEGMIDELWILAQALPPEVLSNVGVSRTKAANPVPAGGATDVVTDVVLAWEAGKFAAAHDVYFGTAFDDVNDASRADPKGVLGSQGQTATEFDPAGLLEYGKTYYWRIDEVNAAPDNTIFKGETWSFTAEPFAYPVQPIAATASSAVAGMGPEKTINRAGLNASDEHSTLETDMWLGEGPGANWILYEFDKAYKLHEMWVWNSNQMIEAFIGFGARNVAVECSLDGETWTAVEGVPEFAQATGLPTYTANTTVSLGGAVAKFVKLTVNASWGGLSPQTGLSEVRFFQVPIQAREPSPADAAVNVGVDAELVWRPGREATSHKVFFGTDEAAVADGTAAAGTVTERRYTPAALNLGTKYFWKVDEIGDAGTYEGNLWSFTTREYAVVDDFESYTDDEGSRIYETWVDGLTDGKSNSVVGYLVAPFAERTIIHGGKQSMPVEYNNVNTPFFSEASREFAPAQNWTVSGADSLNLWVRGVPAAYVETAGTITMSAAGTDIWGTADDFRYAFKTLTGDGSILVKVESLVNTNAWAKAGVMIRQDLTDSSKFVYFIQSFSSGVSMGWRPTVAAACGSVTQAAIVAPQWVKLTRKGDVFTAQYSADGTTWTDLKNADGTIASTTVAMTNPVYVGLAVTSHNVNATTTAVMSGVVTAGNVTGGTWQVQAIGNDPQQANSPADLYVIVQDSAGKSATATHPTIVTSAGWTQWTIPLSTFTGVNLKSVKKLYIGAGSKTSPVKGGPGMFYIDDIGFGRPAVK